MPLPEQIRKQTEAVQQLYAQVNGDDEAGDSKSEKTSTADETIVEDTDTTEKTGHADEIVNEEAPHSDEQEPKQSKNSKDDEETLMQKYRTLQGMYNAEVPRLHSQNKELQQRVQQMEQLLSTLSSEQQQSQSTQAMTEAERLVSEQDVEEYGESIDIMRKVSREEYMPVTQKIAQLEKYLEQLQSSVVPQVNNLAQQQKASTEQQFWSQLSSSVPNWREINDDPDFQTWLLEVDPLFGIRRQTMLEDAQRNFDSERVANFFNTWMSQTGRGEAKAAQNSRRSSELEKQVAPGRARNSASSTASDAKTYSPEDIKKFFNDVRQGKYKGREKERDRMERDIFAAQAEGRIVNS